MIDRELVTRKLVLIAQDLPAIEKLAARPRDEYLASPTDEVLAGPIDVPPSAALSMR